MVNLLKLPISNGQPFSGVKHGYTNILKYLKFKNWSSEYTIHFSNKHHHKNTIYMKYINETKNVRSSQLGKSLILGGDHSTSIPTIVSSIDLYPESKILWIDAHADINIPSSSPSGNMHGMMLGLLTGHFDKEHPLSKYKCIDTNQIAYIGLRDLDPYEQDFLDKHNIKYFTSNDVINDTTNVLEKINTWLNNDKVHVSFDIDVVDPEIVIGTGTPVKNGLNKLHVSQIIDLIKNNNWHTFEIVEVNPELDKNNQTSIYAANIIDQLLEK